MTLALNCPCGATLSLPDALAGQQGRCPGCDRLLVAPQPAPSQPTYTVIRVDCACGRRVAAPVVRLRSGQARCPSCDATLVSP